MDLKQLEAVAKEEMAKHGLQDWAFGLAKTKRRLGVCKYRTKRIEIAGYYALNNSEESVLDTLRHEIAHALAGPKAGHGLVWKEIAVRIGAAPRACDSSPDTVVQTGDWQATCPGCKRTFHRYKRPKNLSGYRCKCVAQSPLTFEYKGDFVTFPVVPVTVQESANWEAKCGGCNTVHFRTRKPKDGIWRCKCPHRCELTWQFRSPKSSHEQ